MYYYLALLLLVMFTLVFIKNTFGHKDVVFTSILLILFFSLRNYTVGTDTIEYVRAFSDGQYTSSIFEFRRDVEPALQWITYIISSYTDNYFWLFIFCGLITVPVYLFFFRMYSTNYILSVFLFIALGTYTFMFNGLRQGIAIAITVIATVFMINCKFIYYLLGCLLASLFHISALLMIPFYFFVNSKILLNLKLTFAVLLSLVFSRLIIGYVAGSNDRYAAYAEVSERSGGLIILGFYLIIAISVFLYRVQVKEIDFAIKKLCDFYILGVFFMLPVALLASDPSGPQRIIYYFTWVLSVILPTVFAYYLKNRLLMILFLLFFTFYYFITTSKFSKLIPYDVNPAFVLF